MIIRLILILTVFASLMSQLPVVIEMGYDLYLKAMWFLPFAIALCLHTKSFADRQLWILYGGIVCMTIYCAILDALTEQTYLNIDIYNMWISLMVATTSYSIYKHYGCNKILHDTAIVSIIGSVILSYVVYTLYFTDYDIMNKVFAFNAKNSMGQILLNCGIVIGLLYIPRNIALQSVKWISIASIVIMLFLLKSRATLLGSFFVVGYMIIQSRSKRVRWLTITACIIVITYILRNASAYETIVNGILLAGRDANDVNEVSSERIQTIKAALEIIPDNLCFGTGDKYLDCMPIAMILQFGIFGAMIVFTFLAILARKIARFNRANRLHLVSYLLFIAMMLNSLFEAWPPFGPGVKCFMMWMMLGFSLAIGDKSNKLDVAKTTR